MKKIFSFLTALMLGVACYAATPDVTLDFSEAAWGFPDAATTSVQTFTSGDYTITVSDGAKKQNAGLLFGKSGAYIQLPAFASPVAKIKTYGQSGASGKVTFNVFVGEAAVSTEAKGATEDHEFEIASASQAAGTIYVIKNTNANNNQITKIEIFYAAGGEEGPTYTVAGSPTTAFGSSWDEKDTKNDMVKQEDGSYKWEKAGCELAAGNVEFKVVKDHDWNEGANAWPATNYVLPIAESGVYTITITFEPENENKISAVATKTADLVVLPTVILHGNFTGEWANTEAFVAAEDKKTASLELTLAEGTFNFGFKFDGAWKANGATIDREHNTTSLAEGSGDMSIVADEAGKYTFVYTFETQAVEVTFPAKRITCDAVYSLAKNDEVALKDVTVTYVNGKNVYVKDATGSMLLFLPAAGSWKAGDVLSGVAGVVDIYNGLYEVKPSAAQVAAVVVTPGEAPEPVELTGAPVAADVNKYVIIKGVSVSAAAFPSSKNLDATIGEETFVLRNQFNASVAFDTEKKYDITGAVAIYTKNDETTVQLYFISAEESPVPVTITATPNIEGAGTITGAGSVLKGESVTLKATANAGYHFCGWADGETNATRTFTATEDVTYVALFRANVANPYAYALTSTYDDQTKKLSVEYALNAPADKVEIVIYNGDDEIDVQEQAADGLTVGKHTATIDCETFVAKTKLTWAVRVNGLSPLAPVQHGTQYSMYCPHGVAVDNNPESEYFGRILATESMHSVTSKTAQAYISGSEANGAGIYAFSPDFKVIASAEGKNVFNGGETFKNTFTGYGAGTAYAPLKVRISDDGRIFATALDDRGTFLWELSQDLTTWTPLISGTINEGVIRDNEGKFLGALNASLQVVGSGEDLKLLALSCNGTGYQGFNGKNYFVHEYKIGTAKTLTAAPDSLFSLDGITSVIVASQATLVYDGEGGYWLGNSRSSAAEIQLAHLNAQGKRDWYASTGGFYGGGGVMFKDGLLYVGKDRTNGSVGNFGIYTVNRDEQGVVTGIKEVFAVRCDGIGRNINDFAMDFGHNLFIVGNSSEKIELFALPYDGENETPAAQKFAFYVGGVPTAITTINDELAPVEKVVRNGQVLIIKDGKTYNMMGQIVK